MGQSSSNEISGNRNSLRGANNRINGYLLFQVPVEFVADSILIPIIALNERDENDVVGDGNYLPFR